MDVVMVVLDMNTRQVDMEESACDEKDVRFVTALYEDGEDDDAVKEGSDNK
jgi:hypothetical protein